jgi:hypothetical protein
LSSNAIRAVNIFLSKSETARNTRTADIFWLSTIFHFFCHLLERCRAIIKSCRADFSSNRNSSSSPCPEKTQFFLTGTFPSKNIAKTQKIINKRSLRIVAKKNTIFTSFWIFRNCVIVNSDLNKTKLLFFNVLGLTENFLISFISKVRCRYPFQTNATIDYSSLIYFYN